MKPITNHEASTFTTIDDHDLARVAGGETDWVNIGGGIAAGFCAFGPIALTALKGVQRVAAVARPVVL